MRRNPFDDEFQKVFKMMLEDIEEMEKFFNLTRNIRNIEKKELKNNKSGGFSISITQGPDGKINIQAETYGNFSNKDLLEYIENLDIPEQYRDEIKAKLGNTELEANDQGISVVRKDSNNTLYGELYELQNKVVILVETKSDKYNVDIKDGNLIVKVGDLQYKVTLPPIKPDSKKEDYRNGILTIEFEKQ
jgi:hypothetical protein